MVKLIRFAFFSLGVLLFPDLSRASVMPWSSEAHSKLIHLAFPNERADCLQKIQEGSEWVDGILNQLPSRSFMHSMRSGRDQPVAEARDRMASFIQRSYEMASALRERAVDFRNGPMNSDVDSMTPDGFRILDGVAYLEHCYQRGIGLHPVMDSTSPAHAGFEVWSLTDLDQLLKHGDFPDSLESALQLSLRPELKEKTVGLMRLVDQIYLGLGMLDYRFDN
jgi:hypothetical protein